METPKKPVVCFDLTTSWRWRFEGNVAGIVRVERQLGLGVLTRFPDRVIFCRYDQDYSRYRLVDHRVAREVFQGGGHDGSSAVHASSQIQRRPAGLARALNGLGKRVVRAFPARMQPRIRRRLIAAREFAKTILAGWREFRQAVAEAPIVHDITATIKQADKSMDFLDSNCVYFSGGLDWDDKIGFLLWQLKKKRGFKVAAMVYDLIPIYFPQYAVEGYYPFFMRHFVDLMWTADRILTISRASLRQIAAAIEEFGTNHPLCSVLQLGVDHIERSNAPKPLPDWGLEAGQFVLYVSMIEPRKNHELLYKVWMRLAERQADICIPLVFVGKPGWLVSDLLATIRTDPRAQERIKVLSDISDSDLSWLYQNCRFAVFPSHFEGWGLGLAEALSVGKYCLASDGGALPEASQGLVTHLDPMDFAGWYNEIKLLLADDAELARREKLVRDRYRRPGWDAAIGEFMATLLETAETPSSPSVHAHPNDRKAHRALA